VLLVFVRLQCCGEWSGWASERGIRVFLVAVVSRSNVMIELAAVAPASLGGILTRFPSLLALPLPASY